MGQAGSMRSMMSSYEEDGDVEPLDSNLLQIRQRLLAAIKHGGDCSSPLIDLLYLKCPVTMKYAVLNVRDLLQNNNRTIQILKNIPVALNILEKYGRHLLKPRNERNELWRYVKFSNPIFRDRVDPLKGGRELMKLMGYQQEIEDGLAFPVDKEPDLEQTANLVADIILAKKEMEMYLSGTHPQPQAMDKFVPPDIVADLQMLRVGVSMSDLTAMQHPVIAVHNTELKEVSRESSQTHLVELPKAEAEEREISPKFCDICGRVEATKLCNSCDNKLLCDNCDDMWHRHPRRQNHPREVTSPTKCTKRDDFSSATVQGPFGIQARPGRDASPRKEKVKSSSWPINVSAQNVVVSKPHLNIASNTAVYPPQRLSLQLTNPQQEMGDDDPTPSAKLRNMPDLDSLVQKTLSISNVEPVSSTSQGQQMQLKAQIPSTLPEQQTKFMPQVPPMLQGQQMKFVPQMPATFHEEQINQKPQIPDRSLKPLSLLQSQSITQNPSARTGLPPPISVYYPPDNIGQPSYNPGHSPSAVSMEQTKSSVQRTDSLSSKLLSKIQEIPDVEKRKSKCDINIMTLEEEIEECDQVLNQLIETQPTFYEDQEFMSLNKKKGLLTREKKTLEKYRKELELGRVENRSSMTTQSEIFFPPSTVNFLSNSVTSHSSGQDGGHQTFLNKSHQVELQPSNQQYPPASNRFGQNVPFTAMGPPIMNQTKLVATGSVPQQNSLQTRAGPKTVTVAGVVPRADQGASMTVTPGSEQGDPQSAQVQPVSMGAAAKNSESQFGASGPTLEWQCEHCTMFNVTNTRICKICHRTSDNPTFIQTENSGEEGTSCPDNDVTSASANATNQIAERIAHEQDQVYFEKQQAHRLFQESLRKEKAGTQKAGSGKSDPPHIQQRVSPTPEMSKHSQEPVISQKKREPVVSQEKLEPVVSQEKREPVVSQEKGKPVAVVSSPSLSSSISIQRPLQSGPSLAGDSMVQGSNLSFQETIANINEQRQRSKMQLEGADLLNILKSAERNDFDVDEAIVAIEQCQANVNKSLEWLKTSWFDSVEKVVQKVSERKDMFEQNNIGDISHPEARKALLEKRGNVEEAVAYCIQTRMELYEKVNPDGQFAREDVLEAMLDTEGDKERIIQCLDQKKLAHFQDRIWEGHEGDDLDALLAMGQPGNFNSVSTSIIGHPEFQDIVTNEAIDLERRIRMVLVEARLQSWGRAETVIKIVENELENLNAENEYNFTLEDVVEAVRNCQNKRSSIIYLQRECLICMSKFPMSKMMNLNICQCQMCRSCLRRHFEISIREKHVRYWTCPNCDLPDFNNETVSQDYLSFLELMVKTLVDKEEQDLFEIKVRDWGLQKDKNFRWCAHCGNGFVYHGWQNDRGQLNMTCPQCRKKTCFLCKKQWEDQHDGLTCEQFTQWKLDNDEDNQAQGLARVLEESGIDCPSCKMRYSLAKGGCMHFTCPECAHEFCSGCSEPFYKQGMCQKFTKCQGQGLHCHHPRDCFFYLRDNDVEELQTLLKQGKVTYNVNATGEQRVVKCPVMEQKDGDVGASSKQDEACGKEVKDGHAGLCVVHYKEYLVGLINRHKLDPVQIMEIKQIERLIERMELTEQKKRENETPGQHRKRLVTYVKQYIPLQR